MTSQPRLTPRLFLRRALVGLAVALVWACGSGESTEGFVDAGSSDATQTGDVRVDGPRHRDSGAAHDARAHDAHADSSADSGHDGGPQCVAPEVECTTGCKSLGNDPQNCGTCGNACSAGLVCSSGSCSVSCGAMQMKCGVPDGGVPEGGVADSGAGHDAGHDAGSRDAAGGGADAGQNPSGEYCADLGNDRLNCGACGNICPYGPESTPVCSAGTCSIACQPGYGNCDHNPDNGCEANLNTSPSACGGCGNVCDVPNASAGCVSGACTVGACLPGFADCDGKATNGCETNIDTPANCGGCGNTCTLNNATPTCPTGTCAILHCNTGFSDCNHNPADGCEIATSTDVNNCGGCGTVCHEANASSVCNNGTCGIGTCNTGFADCDLNPTDGCEVNLTNNANNCGSCNAACTLPNAIAGCALSACTVVACTGGWGNCDGVAANGCETSTATSPNNCGTCENVCSLAHATAGCASGGCTIATCQTGYKDCNGLPGDGCEVNTQGDVNNCGACGNVCSVTNGSAGCSLGACTVVSCNTGFADCDGVVANGCEVNTTSNPADCGGCGNACLLKCAPEVASTQCVNSACQILSCDTGYADFDQVCTDGCECKESSTQSACGNAIDLFAGTIQPGQSITPYVSNMIPLSVTEAYFTITFGGNGSTSFHPHISLASTNNEFLMDVTSDCSGSKLTTCTDNGSGDSDGVLQWETSYSGVSPAGDPNSKTPGGVSNFDPINVGQVWIRVYRKNGVTPTCNNYTITAGD